MKTKLIIPLCLLALPLLHGNPKPEPHALVFESWELDEKPAFPGGIQALQIFLAEHVKYPEQAREAGIEGSMVFECIIDPEGRLRSVEVVKKLGFGCESEVRRILTAMPNWEPGKIRGKAVSTRLFLTIRFYLEH